MSGENRNETVDALRAFAAMAVCFFHFTNGEHFRESSILWPISSLGWTGVEVFFVVSGFVIPLAMARGAYSISAWPAFMLKRLIRLEPPYLASIVIVMMLGVASTWVPGFRGPPIEWTFAQVVSHLGYANAVIGLPWLNLAYWTLAIELQFYLLMGLAQPLLVGGRLAQTALLAAMGIAPLVLPAFGEAIIFPYLPIFAMGAVTFLVRQALIPKRQFWLWLGGLFAASFLSIGWAGSIAGAIAALAIAKLELPRVGWIAWLGAISYSLYLLHVPIGGRVINLASRLSPSAAVEIAAVAIACLASILSAWALHAAIERPSTRAAATLKYGNRHMYAVSQPAP